MPSSRLLALCAAIAAMASSAVRAQSPSGSRGATAPVATPGPHRKSKAQKAAKAPAPEPSTAADPRLATQLDELRREVASLRDRLSTLERARSQEADTAARLEALHNELRELRGSVEAKAQREELRDQAQQSARDDALRARALLSSVAQRLSLGDGDVDDALASAASLAPESARPSIAAAREAIRNRDLAGARAQVASALANVGQ